MDRGDSDWHEQLTLHFPIQLHLLSRPEFWRVTCSCGNIDGHIFPSRENAIISWIGHVQEMVNAARLNRERIASAAFNERVSYYNDTPLGL